MSTCDIYVCFDHNTPLPGSDWGVLAYFSLWFCSFFFSVNELNALCHRHRGTAHHLYSFACVIIDITEESGMGLGR